MYPLLLAAARKLVLAVDSPGYMYHVTFLFALPGIRSRGLLSGSGVNFPGYTGHAQGRTFLCDYDGVNFWMHKLKDVAHGQSDNAIEDGYIPVVIAVDMLGMADEEDHLGKKDSYHEAVWVDQPVLPRRLRVWDGKKWQKVGNLNLDAMKQMALDAATIEEPDPDDEDGEAIVWPKYDVFKPGGERF